MNEEQIIEKLKNKEKFTESEIQEILWDFSIELNKKINDYAEEINRIIEYINKNTK